MSDYRTLAEDALALLATGQPGHEAERVRDVIAFLRAGLPPTFDKVAHTHSTETNNGTDRMPVVDLAREENTDRTARHRSAAIAARANDSVQDGVAQTEARETPVTMRELSERLRAAIAERIETALLQGGCTPSVACDGFATREDAKIESLLDELDRAHAEPVGAVAITREQALQLRDVALNYEGAYALNPHNAGHLAQEMQDQFAAILTAALRGAP